MSPRHLALTTFVTVVALAAVPGCSTTNPPAPSSTTVTVTTTSAAPQAHGVYEQCLTAHGVPSPAAGPPPGPGPQPQGPLPGPPPNAPADGTSATPPAPPGVDEATWANAQKACASLQPAPPTPTS